MEKKIKIKIINHTEEKKRAILFGFRNIGYANFGSEQGIELVNETEPNSTYMSLLHKFKDKDFQVESDLSK